MDRVLGLFDDVREDQIFQPFFEQQSQDINQVLDFVRQQNNYFDVSNSPLLALHADPR